MNALANPLSMFQVKGKVALITGASGAFGMVAARVLAGAGCKLVDYDIGFGHFHWNQWDPGPDDVLVVYFFDQSVGKISLLHQLFQATLGGILIYWFQEEVFGNLQ